MKISVMLNNFAQPFDQALQTAAHMGIEAVQVTVAPEDDAATRAHMSRTLRESGIATSATSVDLGDWGEAEANAQLEKLKPLIDATPQMHTRICQGHIGIMPYAMQGERWNRYLRCGEMISKYAESAGVVIALETGPEPPRVMAELIRQVGSPALGANYDPANLIIWPAALPRFADLQEHTGEAAPPYNRQSAFEKFEPVEGVARLAPHIFHTHVKDAIGDGGWEDVPLGTGWVDWPRYFGLLQASGYDGYLAIEREGGANRVGEIGAAMRFVQEQLALLK